VPEGSRRAESLSELWLERISECEGLIWRRPDFRRSILSVATLILERVDFGSRTSTPGWQWLMAEAGIRSTSTLNRAINWLIRHGFLGKVAGGRQAMYTPESSNLYARWGDGGPVADRAIYVLCEPLTDAELAVAGEQEARRMHNKGTLNGLLTGFSAAVDINRNPIQQEPKRNPKGIREWASPMLKGYFQALSERVQALRGQRPDLQWPRHATTNANDEATTRHNELQAARTIQWYAPSLARKRATTVANMFRRCFRAGWTAADVLHALEHRPDGSLWSHDGFTGASEPAAVAHARLNLWKVGGEPIMSQTQRILSRRQPALDRAIEVARERAKRERLTV
jgi:hypothetical protein